VRSTSTSSLGFQSCHAALKFPQLVARRRQALHEPCDVGKQILYPARKLPDITENRDRHD
jgi:hypothetical protein